MGPRWLCAGALVATAVIHAAVVPEHLHEWPAAGVFFIALTAVELVLAVAVVARGNRSLLTVGAAVSVASAAVWAVSRSVGLPFGPEIFTPEVVGTPDIVATALEIATAALFVHLAVGERTHVASTSLP